MSVDYEGRSGFGFAVTKERLEEVVGFFPLDVQDELRDDNYSALGAELSRHVTIVTAGNCYTGELRYYIALNHTSYIDIVTYADRFIAALNTNGFNRTLSDLTLITDYMVL